MLFVNFNFKFQLSICFPYLCPQRCCKCFFVPGNSGGRRRNNNPAMVGLIRICVYIHICVSTPLSPLHSLLGWIERYRVAKNLGSLIFTGQILQRCLIFSGSFVENDLQLMGSYESSPPCIPAMDPVLQSVPWLCQICHLSCCSFSIAATMRHYLIKIWNPRQILCWNIVRPQPSIGPQGRASLLGLATRCRNCRYKFRIRPFFSQNSSSCGDKFFATSWCSVNLPVNPCFLRMCHQLFLFTICRTVFFFYKCIHRQVFFKCTHRQVCFSTVVAPSGLFPKVRELLGFAIVNEKTPASLGYPISVCNKNFTFMACTVNLFFQNWCTTTLIFSTQDAPPGVCQKLMYRVI